VSTSLLQGIGYPAHQVQAMIPIRGLIDRAMADRVERRIAELHPRDALTTRINSHGGDPAIAVRIARALRAHHGHTTAHVTGQCDSAAIIVLAAARSRYAGRDARSNSVARSDSAGMAR
jgi:ATP-dependent protease ClpP protease subunit